jgi:hypothetical protein
LSLLAAAIAGLPVQVLAQTTNKTAAAKKPVTKEAPKAEKKKSAHPFHGKLAAVDKSAKTIKIGQSVYEITSETKITKGNKPAVLEDGVVGDEVGGYAKPTEDGKMAATTLRFGPKSDGKDAEKKKGKNAN